jgi:hypothetical protein
LNDIESGIPYLEQIQQLNESDTQIQAVISRARRDVSKLKQKWRTMDEKFFVTHPNATVRIYHGLQAIDPSRTFLVVNPIEDQLNETTFSSALNEVGFGRSHLSRPQPKQSRVALLTPDALLLEEQRIHDTVAKRLRYGAQPAKNTSASSAPAANETTSPSETPSVSEPPAVPPPPLPDALLHRSRVSEAWLVPWYAVTFAQEHGLLTPLNATATASVANALSSLFHTSSHSAAQRTQSKAALRILRRIAEEEVARAQELERQERARREPAFDYE